MKMIKPLFLSATTALLLASCAGTAPILSTPISNIDNTPVLDRKLSEEELKDWGHKDLISDSIPGMSIEKAYELLKDRTGQKVIVAVVDSGIDVEHEDLKNVIWTNTKEIPGNNKDDDNNGYVDDIHGWNFLGESNAENMELTRILRDNSIADAATVARAQAEYDSEIKNFTQRRDYYQDLMNKAEAADKAIAKHLGKEKYSYDDVKGIETEDETLKGHLDIAKRFLSRGAESMGAVITQIKGGVDYFDGRINGSYFDMKTDFRKVVGDNPNDINDNKYGNGNVYGPEPDGAFHGTHVAGIIAAERNNGKGINGVAHNVEIMAVRAVPDGDEYDKDIALALRYAVDNGAKVINTSFGKYYSPHSKWVMDAIKYAAEKDVLIVNAAGNDSKDIDTVNVYPNDQVDNGAEISDTFITIGALNFEYGSKLPASFSNYGKNNVDVFAPGVQIYSTTPEGKYGNASGTSMAAPNTAGVAALIRSYFPKLKASQVKQILMDSGLPLQADVVVGENGAITKPFGEISKSGKAVNAYNALIMASKMK